MAVSDCIKKVEVRFKETWKEMEDIALGIPRERAYTKMTITSWYRLQGWISLELWKKRKKVGLARIEKMRKAEPERRLWKLWEPYHIVSGSQQGFGSYLREMQSHFRVFSDRLTPSDLQFGRIAQAALWSADCKDTQIRNREAC